MIESSCSTRLFHPLSLIAVAALQVALWPHARAQTATPSQSASAMHLTLPSAIDMAIAHNRKLALARLSIKDSEEQKRIAQSHYYPSISNVSKVNHLTELEGITIPAGAFAQGGSTGLIPARTLRLDQGSSTSYISGTGLEQPFTQAFRIHAGVKAAEADLNTAKLQASDSENAIALEVHQLYYSYLIEQLNGSSAEDARKAASINEEEQHKGVQEGRLLANVELASRADLLEKQRAVLVSRLNLDDLTLRLDDLLGLPFGTKLQLDPDAFGALPELPPRDVAIARVIERSPTILIARESVERARAGLSAARDAYIPNITGLARYDYQSGLPFFEHNFGSFGASLTYDLFDGGAREASLRDAHVKLSMAQTQLIQAEDDVRVELSADYDKVEELAELLKVSQLMLETREESYRIETQRAHVDAALASTVETAHAAVTAAQLSVLSSQLDLYLAQNNIKKLLGEMPR